MSSSPRGAGRRPVDRQAILVTGATDGLGRALSRELAARGATVLLHGRSEQRLAETIEGVRAATGNDRLRSYRADLSDLDETRTMARAVLDGEERLDALVNNAGIGGGPPDAPRAESADGIELRFAVNYLAPFVLTGLLLPLLRRSAPARIVNVSSLGQAPIEFDDVMLERGYRGFRAYAQSKLAQISFTVELARRLEAAGETGVTVNAVHPATLMNTKMVFESVGRATSSIEDGVEAVLPLVVSPDLEGVTGRFFDRLREARAHEQVDDPEARRRLWALSEELAGASFDRQTDR